MQSLRLPFFLEGVGVGGEGGGEERGEGCKSPIYIKIVVASIFILCGGSEFEFST